MCLSCKKSFKCHKRTTICIGVCALICLVLGIVLPIVMHQFLLSAASTNAIMTPETRNMWGMVPGDTKMVVVRSFQFFNFTNPYETVFLNETPLFIETEPYEYQEFQNFTNVTYRTLNDSNLEVIDFNYWEYMHELEKGNKNDKVQIANLAAFGAWYQLKPAEDYVIAIQAFGQLIGGLEDEIYEFALAQGVLGMLLSTKEEGIAHFLSIGIVPEKAELLWEDKQFGWKNATTFHVWVKAARDGVFSLSAKMLRDYFHLIYTKIDALLRYLKDNVDMIEIILVNNYCKDKTKFNCDSRFLSVLQWTSQGVTKNPPGGVGGSDSIMSTNNTAEGYPEISYFLEEYFFKKISNSSEYHNVTFNATWAYKVTARSGDAKKWLTEPFLIFHQGNLKFLFEKGKIFEETKNLSDLQSIKERFLLDNIYQTHVFWAYFNYLVSEFAVMKPNNGSKESLGLGALSSQFFYQNFMNIKDFLLPEIRRKGLLAKMEDFELNCVKLMNFSITEAINYTDVCLDQNLTSWDENSMDFLQSLCISDGSAWNSFRLNHNLSKENMFELCGNVEKPQTFQSLLIEVNSLIKKQYNCSIFEDYCSEMELALKQWGHSEITNNPLPLLNRFYNKSLSVSDWNPIKFEKSLEFLAFLNISKLNTSNLTRDIDRKGFSDEKSEYLLTFDVLFNAVIDSKAFILYQNNNISAFETLFQYDNPLLLLNYLRYITFEFAFGGITITKSVKEILLGFEVPFLKTMQEQDPALGGNPSVPIKMGLCPNLTLEDAIYNPQSMYTGKGDTSKIRQYNTVNGSPNISQIIPDFDGNVTRNISRNPWNENLAIWGSDGFTNTPNLNPDGDDVHVFVTMLFRFSRASQHEGSRNFNGLNGNLYRMDSSLTDINPVYNQNRWNGFINFSSVMNAPVFNSKRHFLDVDQNVTKLTKVYRKEIKEENLIVADKNEDDIYLYIEPYSGLSLSAFLKLQTNVELKQNLLFNTDNYAMLPVFSIVRGGDIPDSTVDDLLMPLKIGIMLENIIFRAVFFSLAGILIIVTLILARQWHKKAKTTREEEEILLNQKQTNL